MSVEKSLRESTLKGMKSVFEQLLATLADTPSKPVIVRELTESFHYEEEMIGRLCDEMESRLRAQQESHLSAFKEAVNVVVDRAVALMNQPGDLNFPELEMEFNNLKEVQTVGLQEMDQLNAEFIEGWRQEFVQKTKAAIHKFHDVAVRIMTRGVVADDAMNNIDPETSPKQ